MEENNKKAKWNAFKTKVGKRMTTTKWSRTEVKQKMESQTLQKEKVKWTSWLVFSRFLVQIADFCKKKKSWTQSNRVLVAFAFVYSTVDDDYNKDDYYRYAAMWLLLWSSLCVKNLFSLRLYMLFEWLKQNYSMVWVGMSVCVCVCGRVEEWEWKRGSKQKEQERRRRKV